MVTYTTPSTGSMTYILIGDAFLQNYYAQFVYNGDGVTANNTMQLTLSNYALPTSYLGNKIFEQQVEPEPEPTPTPEPDPIPEPPTPPTPTPTPSGH